MQRWKDDLLEELIQEAELCDKKMPKSVSKMSEEKAIKVFSGMILQGKIRQALRFITDRSETGGILSPALQMRVGNQVDGDVFHRSDRGHHISTADGDICAGDETGQVGELNDPYDLRRLAPAALLRGLRRYSSPPLHPARGFGGSGPSNHSLGVHYNKS